MHQFTITFLVEIMREVPAGSGTMAPRTVRVTLSSDAPGSKMAVTGSGLKTNEIIAKMSGLTQEELNKQLAAGRLRAVEISISVLSNAAIVRRNAGDGLSDADYARHTFHYSRVVSNVPTLMAAPKRPAGCGTWANPSYPVSNQPGAVHFLALT